MGILVCKRDQLPLKYGQEGTYVYRGTHSQSDADVGQKSQAALRTVAL